MATCTAMVFLGKRERDEGGIQIMHMMRLYENDSSRICIDTPSGRDRDGKMLGLWMCTHNALEDMMLMAAVYALKDKATADACREVGCGENTLDMPWDLHGVNDKLPGLYDLAKAAFKAISVKIVVVSLEGSQISRQLENAMDYVTDVELCPSAYDRHYSEWSSTIEESGNAKGVLQ